MVLGSLRVVAFECNVDQVRTGLLREPLEEKLVARKALAFLAGSLLPDLDTFFWPCWQPDMAC